MTQTPGSAVEAPPFSGVNASHQESKGAVSKKILSWEFFNITSYSTTSMARVDGHSTKVWIYPRRKAGESGATPARGRNPVQLTRSAVAALFPTPQADAAQVLGISITALKAVCRKLGISRWPYMRGNKALASPFKFELVQNDWPVPQISEESKPIFACTTATRFGVSSQSAYSRLQECDFGKCYFERGVELEPEPAAFCLLDPPATHASFSGCESGTFSSASLSRVASSAITVPRTASAGPGPSQACDLGDDSMHAIGGDAFVSSSGAGDGNTIEAGFKLSVTWYSGSQTTVLNPGMKTG